MNLKAVIALAKKEFLTYINSPIAYIFIAVFILLSNWFFFSDFFIQNQASMRTFFAYSSWLLVLIIPALTMRLWAEEKKSGTIEQLLTLPITAPEASLGKFLGTLLFFIITLLFTLNIPLTVQHFGSLDWGVTGASYLSLILLGASFIALGMFISSTTSNQIAAFMTSLIACAILFLLGTPLVTNSLPTILKSIAIFLGAGTYYENSLRGLIDSRNLVYFLSLIVVFLALNTLNLKQKDRQLSLKLKDSTLAQTVIIIAIAMAFNYLMFLAPMRWDVSNNQANSLSPGTKTILKELKDIVTVKTYFSTNLPPRYISVKQQATDVLTDFQNEAKGSLTVTHLNPENTQDFEKETQGLGIPVLQFNDVEKDRFQVSNGYLGILLTFGDKKEVIPVVENTSNLEYELISAITRLLREKEPQVAFAGDPAPTGEQDRFQLTKQFLGQQYKLQTLSLKDPETLNKEIQTLIVTTPQAKFTEEELTTLDKLIAKGVGVMFLIDGVTVDMNLTAAPLDSGINQILQNIGLAINQDLVIDRSNDLATFNTGYTNIVVPYPFWVKVLGTGLGKNVIVNKLETITLPWVSSLTQTTESDRITPLLWSSPYSTLQTKQFDLNPQIETPENKTDPILLAALYTGPYKDNQSTKIIVVGDGDFVDSGMLQRFRNNALFLMNSVDYLSQDERLIGIRAKTGMDSPLNLNETTNTDLVKIANVLTPIILMLILGFSRSRIRKSRHYELT